LMGGCCGPAGGTLPDAGGWAPGCCGGTSLGLLMAFTVDRSFLVI
jgi:hypothetical protein